MKLRKEIVQKVADKATQVAEGIEEPYKSLIYPIIFKNLLDEEILEERMSPEPMREKVPEVLLEHLKPKSQEQSQEDISKILVSNFDWSKYIYIHKIEPYEQYLLVLKIAHEEFGIDGLSPPEITKILFEKFRISKTYNAVSMALSGLRGKDVDRIRRGTSFVYRISKLGLDRIRNSYDDLASKGELENV